VGNAAHLIGLAGERGVRFALILGDHGRVAGRTGMGAVMGSKNLKAVAVRGRGRIALADDEGYARLRSRVNRELRQDLVSQGMRDFGTSSASEMFDYFGMMPKRYFGSGILEGADAVSGVTVAETILSGVSACHGCVIACGRRVRLKDGVERKGPEYETTIGFGPNLGITDLQAIARFGELCDRYGMDTISLSSALGLACALAEEGRLAPGDMEGLNLSWGNVEAVEKAINNRTKRTHGFAATEQVPVGSDLSSGRVEHGRSVSSPNRATMASSTSDPGAWTSRTSRSASITSAPHVRNSSRTVDLPEATLPVRATDSTVVTAGSSGLRRAAGPRGSDGSAPRRSRCRRP